MPKGVHGRRLTDKQRITFLAALAAGKTVKDSAELAEIDATYVYTVRKVDEDFADQWADAMALRADLRADKVRDKAYEVAMDDDHKAQPQILGKLLDALPEHRVKPSDGEGADGIAEAIDRFTTTVLQLAQRQPARDLPPTPPSRPGLAALVAPGEGES